MMRTKTTLLALALAFAPAAMAQNAAPMTPAQAIAAVQTGEVTGSFEFVVGSAAAVGFTTYLNSEADYRDPGNLTIELHSAAINALKEKLGGFPEEVLKGKRVRVKGVARRVPVGNYFQTRIVVESADQLQVVG